MNGAFEEQVRERAYAMWVECGRIEGQAHQHWTMAECELIEAATRPKRRVASKKAKPAAASVKAVIAKAEVASAEVAAVRERKPAVGAKPAARKASAGKASPRGKARPDAAGVPA